MGWVGLTGCVANPYFGAGLGQQLWLRYGHWSGPKHESGCDYGQVWGYPNTNN